MNFLDPFLKKILREDSETSWPPPQEEEETLNLEQSRTAPPTLDFKGEATSELSQFFMEYQMTVQIQRQISRKEASILLSVCNYEAVHFGVDFSLYFVMEWLFNFLLKSGSREPLEYQEEKGKQTLLICELILIGIRGLWLSLEGREELPMEIRKEILLSKWLPSKQTYGSWSNYHSPRLYFKMRAVRLDIYNERESNSERYSSYCKGYGEGGSLARVQRTPFSFELDGDDTKEPSFSFSLIESSKYNQILTQIEKWKSIKKRD